MEVVPVVKEALGSVSKDFDRWMEKRGIIYNRRDVNNCLVGSCNNFAA